MALGLTPGLLLIRGLALQAQESIPLEAAPQEIIPMESSPGPTPGRPIPDPTGPAYLRPWSPCPTDLSSLTVGLLRDLPSYANRVAIRQMDLARLATVPSSTVLVTSPPDLIPIDLVTQESGVDPTLQQVFFTTLEQQHWPDRTASLQHHHWLFLAPTAEGWHLALLYSSLGPYPTGGIVPGRPPTPPQESSDGIIGQAIRLWLRDCRAGAVFPAAPAESPSPPLPFTTP
jgi:hypothetical protein